MRAVASAVSAWQARSMQGEERWRRDGTYPRGLAPGRGYCPAPASVSTDAVQALLHAVAAGHGTSASSSTTLSWAAWAMVAGRHAQDWRHVQQRAEISVDQPCNEPSGLAQPVGQPASSQSQSQSFAGGRRAFRPEPGRRHGVRCQPFRPAAATPQLVAGLSWVPGPLSRACAERHPLRLLSCRLPPGDPASGGGEVRIYDTR